MSKQEVEDHCKSCVYILSFTGPDYCHMFEKFVPGCKKIKHERSRLVKFDDLPHRLIKGKTMKTIIAGSRSLNGLFLVEEAMQMIHWNVTEVVSGMAKGIDLTGENWAEMHNIPVKRFPAYWRDLEAPGARVKTNRHGRYNANAGHDRNIRMAEYSDALVAIWDQRSRGTKHMYKLAMALELKVVVVGVGPNGVLYKL